VGSNRESRHSTMGGRANFRDFVRREDNGFVNRKTRVFPRAQYVL
jgi:hypothetical protein